ncbi:MAG: peptidoglycan DD-metalloendopeptidase family protein [Candidatus Nomurabacteria bacterium]|nr:MAG: peptidoglycan DD-metalloendopeptidase family protein [Candidatus Nomurabacteria bacterium]
MGAKKLNQKAKYLRISICTLLVAIIAAGGFLSFSWQQLAGIAKAQDVSIPDETTTELINLNSDIENKRDEINDLEKKSQAYQQNINKKLQQSQSIETQLSTLEDQIAQTETDLEKTNLEVEKYGLEIQQVEGSIAKRNEEIDAAKDRIGEFIRVMHRNDSRTYLEISLLHDNFSSYFMQERAVKDIENETKKALDQLHVLKQGLEDDLDTLTDKKRELDEAKTRLESTKDAHAQELEYQQLLLTQVQGESGELQSLLDEVQQQVNQATSEVSVLENRFRDRLSEENIDLDTLLQAQNDFIWPVNPTRGISAYFHDPSYPYRGYFEHNAIDVPTPQGTQVRASADGIVSIARDTNWTTDSRGRRIPAYNYVSIIHGGGISTVYGHLSAVYVSPEQFVRKGEVIGLSGATPGTAGAGLFTTGPHLHLEFRLNGIPVNPLNYLP